MVKNKKIVSSLCTATAALYLCQVGIEAYACRYWRYFSSSTGDIPDKAVNAMGEAKALLPPAPSAPCRSAASAGREWNPASAAGDCLKAAADDTRAAGVAGVGEITLLLWRLFIRCVSVREVGEVVTEAGEVEVEEDDEEEETGVPMMLSMLKPGLDVVGVVVAVEVEVEVEEANDVKVVDEEAAGCAAEDGVAEAWLRGDGGGDGEPFSFSCSSLLSSLGKWPPAAGGPAIAGSAMW